MSRSSKVSHNNTMWSNYKQSNISIVDSKCLNDNPDSFYDVFEKNATCEKSLLKKS